MRSGNTLIPKNICSFLFTTQGKIHLNCNNSTMRNKHSNSGVCPSEKRVERVEKVEKVERIEIPSKHKGRHNDSDGGVSPSLK